MGPQLSYLYREVCTPHCVRALDEYSIDAFCSPNMLLSGSRDKTLIIWNLARDETSFPKRSLHGHSHIVSDCVGPHNPNIWTVG